jgi:protein-S-isoprenylcysteine O-methyltransferase Ste14
MHEIRDNPRVTAPPPLLALAAIVVGLTLDWIFPAYLLTLLLSVVERVVVGALLISAGFALGISANRAFHSAGTHVRPWKPSTALVTDGIFGWLRNPMYVGGTLFLAGISILLASDWTLVMTVVGVAILHFGVVRREEQYLELKFGDAYRQYRGRVPRYGWPG